MFPQHPIKSPLRETYPGNNVALMMLTEMVEYNATVIPES